MTVSIFNGKQRGVGVQPGKDIYIKLGVSFREHLHHFKGARLAVFLAIQLHADENGECHPSYDLLQKETGYGRAAIATALEELCTMTVEGSRVLCRRRLRDERGKFTGSNRYLIYPSQEELKEWEDSPEFDFPTVDLSNCGKSELEEEPYREEEPELKNNGGVGVSTNTASPAPSVPAAVAESATATAQERTQAISDDNNESDLLAALEKLNQGIRSKSGGNVITGTQAIARRLAKRGVTVPDMRKAWQTCKSNANNPVGAFVYWTREEFLPPPRNGYESRTDDKGNQQVWIDGQGWTVIERQSA